MNWYVFHSSLSPKEIRVRLSAYAKETKDFAWSFSDVGFYYRIYSDDRFFLIRTRPTRLGPMARNQRVFNAQLIAEENGTRIEGKFGEIKKNKPLYWFCAVFTLFGCLVIKSILPILVFVPFFLFIPRLLLNIASPFYREEEEAVLSFIRENLLHKSVL